MKKILITGGTKGLGGELTKLFLSQGIQVVALSREALNIGESHVSVDLLNSESIYTAAKGILKEHNDFDAVILCAGGAEIEELGNITEKNLENTIELNLKSHILFMNELVDNIKKNGADIVVIGATIGFKSNKFMPVYSISKWGLRGFVENIREFFQGTKTRIIHIVPGGMNTESNIGPEGREAMISQMTGKKVGTLVDAKEVANMIYHFLLLPQSIEISEIIINRK